MPAQSFIHTNREPLAADVDGRFFDHLRMARQALAGSPVRRTLVWLGLSILTVILATSAGQRRSASTSPKATTAAWRSTISSWSRQAVASGFRSRISGSGRASACRSRARQVPARRCCSARSPGCGHGARAASNCPRTSRSPSCRAFPTCRRARCARCLPIRPAAQSSTTRILPKRLPPSGWSGWQPRSTVSRHGTTNSPATNCGSSPSRDCVCTSQTG